MEKTNHGMSHTRIHNIWCGMKKRCNCNNQNSRDYVDYSNRGIKVCDDWKDFNTFYQWALFSGYSDNLTIERIDVNKGYSPDNCTWIPMSKQARNRRTTRYEEYHGELMSLAEICEIEDVDYRLVHGRLKKGWSLDKALHEPIKGKSELHKKCDALGLNYHSVYSRISMGWSEDDALNTPFLGIGSNQTTY